MPRECLVAGPAGTGKTRPILETIHLLAADIPDLRILFVRATRVSLTESVLVTFEQEVLPADGMESLAAGCGRAHRHSYRYPNGTEIVVAGLDRLPKKVLSTAWDVVYANEAIEIPQDAHETIVSRLGRPGRDSRFGWWIGDTNPDAPTHWLKARCDAGKTALWTTTHEANPTLWDGLDWTDAGRAYLEQLERTLSGVRYLRLRKGLWAGAEGLVYEDYDPAVHLIDPFPIPAEWRRFRSVDFGYVNPFVCQWWAADGDGRMFLYRELYHTGRTVKVHAAQINRLSEGERYEFTTADHDASERATLAENGIRTVPAKKDIQVGIQAVQERLKKQGDGRPRLYIFKNALVERDPVLVAAKLPCCTAEEFGSYVWAKGQDGRTVKEVPVGRDDHGADSLRYAVMSMNIRTQHTENAADRAAADEARRKAAAEAQARHLNPMNETFWRR